MKRKKKKLKKAKPIKSKKFRSKKWKVFVKPYDYHGSDAKYVMYGTSPKI